MPRLTKYLTDDGVGHLLKLANDNSLNGNKAVAGALGITERAYQNLTSPDKCQSSISPQVRTKLTKLGFTKDNFNLYTSDQKRCDAKNIAQRAVHGAGNSTADTLAEIPKVIVLSTKVQNFQLADYREINLKGEFLRSLSCRITSRSPYFRFGFKLLGYGGRIFGDAAIRSQDCNLLVHIGRNHFDRSSLGISAKDVFFTYYVNGHRIVIGNQIELDKKLFSIGSEVTALFELRIDSGYLVNVFVNGKCSLSRIIPPECCQRIVMFGWGDEDEFKVTVNNLTIETARRL